MLPHADTDSPRQVFLFSGHRVDAPDRATPRFPQKMAAAAGAKIAEALDQFGASPQDLALSQAAAGGDLLFLEAALQRGVRCQVLLPFAQAEFIERSVLSSTEGEAWRARYLAVTAQLKDRVREMPEALGALPQGADPYERCNLWLLASAFAHGADRLRFICLWNGAGGDGAGGTGHLFEEVQRRKGHITRIDPSELLQRERP